MDKKEEDTDKILDNLSDYHKRRIRLFWILMGIIIFALIISLIFLFLKSYNYEKQIGLSAEIEKVSLSPDAKAVYIKLAGGSNKENITGVKFIFTDENKKEYLIKVLLLSSQSFL